jgi:chloramphenicol 3-O-phosphotransferase
MARVVFLYGPVASGKLTIARELSALTSFALFHNHLAVDLLLSLFPFGSSPFVLFRERIWLELMESAVGNGSSLIFTFAPDRTVSPSFPAVLQERVARAGGSVGFAEIVCPDEEIERRIEAPSRREFGKLASVTLYRQLKQAGAFEYPRLNAACRVDSSVATPLECARRIAADLNLTRLSNNT